MTHDRKVRDHFSSFHNYPEGIKPSFLTLEESKAETLNSLTEDLKPRGGEFELWPRGLVGSDVLPVPRALLPHEHQRYTVWTTGVVAVMDKTTCWRAGSPKECVL